MKEEAKYFFETKPLTHPVPFLLDGSMVGEDFVNNSFKKIETLEDWQLILDTTRHNLPINLNDASEAQSFLNERLEIVKSLDEANSELKSFLYVHTPQQF